jgi:small subunit ribosomal protein S20
LATRSALKRLRQSEKRLLRNKAVKSELKTCRKKVLAAVEANNKEEAKAQLTKAVSLYDKAVQKGVIKLNTAARGKSRLAGRVNKIS